jgi:hypothetical protein
MLIGMDIAAEDGLGIIASKDTTMLAHLMTEHPHFPLPCIPGQGSSQLRYVATKCGDATDTFGQSNFIWRLTSIS